jgi:hypothetical protein
VHVTAADGRKYVYASGPGVADVPRGAGDLEEFFDFLARESVGELLEDMRADGYDGPDPPSEHDIEWRIGDAVATAHTKT